MKKLMLLILCLALAAALSCACQRRPAEQPPEDPVIPAEQPPETPPEEIDLFAQLRFANYDQVYAALTAPYEGGYRGGVYFGDAVEEEAAADAPAEAPAPAPAGVDMDKGEASQTNVQVEGVDEGDIVKHDGEYIYIIRDDYLSIVSADGPDSAELSAVRLFERMEQDKWAEEEDGSYEYSYFWDSASDIYLYEDRAAVVINHGGWMEAYDAASDEYTNEDESFVYIQLWDISDPASPALLSTLGQDGGYNDSRVLDGILYLVTSYHVWNFQEDDYTGFIPRLYTNGLAELTAVEDIIAMPGGGDSTSYLVVSAIDLAAGDMLASQSVLGGGNATMYMSYDNIFLATQTWRQEASEARTESVYTVIDYTERCVTDLLRLAVEPGGGFTLAATGTVPGYVLGQFALDQYNGYLRIVTTDSSYSYSTYEDTEFGFINYKYPEEGQPRTSGLYVLDPDLGIVGRVDGLAEEERVYSVRFAGDVGYFVTFREIDPLFAVDLSDPAAPTIMSELKIPGFSEYLHFWDEDLLLGIGYNVTDQGRTEGLKLSMFDTSDPYNVTETAMLALEAGYSPVTSDHHAALIDLDKNIIAFPTDMGYEIYSYDPEDHSFSQTASISIEDYGYNTRGLYISEWLYVATPFRVYVASLADWSLAATVDLTGDEGVYYEFSPAGDMTEEPEEEPAETPVTE